LKQIRQFLAVQWEMGGQWAICAMVLLFTVAALGRCGQ